MSKVVETLIRKESNGTLSFGDFTLAEKKKVSDFNFGGDVYKVKTFNEITKLECNEMFVYESVPGTAVFNFVKNDKEVTFSVIAKEDAQITLELEENADYEVMISGADSGKISTGLGGKLSFSVESDGEEKQVKVVRK